MPRIYRPSGAGQGRWWLARTKPGWRGVAHLPACAFVPEAVGHALPISLLAFACFMHGYCVSGSARYQPCCCFPTTLKHNPFILYHKKNHRPNEMRARVALAQHQKGRSPSGARFRHIIASKVPKSERSKVQSGPKLHCFGKQFSSWVGVTMPRCRPGQALGKDLQCLRWA